MTPRHLRIALAAALVAAISLAPTRAQTTRPARDAPALPATTSAPAIVQPEEFRQLAAKAGTLKGVYVKGVATVEGPKDADLPEELRRIDFEIWARPPLAMLKVSRAAEEFRLSDGQFVYALRRTPEGEPRGRRRRLTASNYYSALEVAAVVCDAANGYANLAAGVKFSPVEFQTKLAEGMPPLKWFRLEPVAKPPHILLKDAESVTVGMDPSDGLIRVLVGRMVEGESKATIAVVFREVRHAPVADQYLGLPAAAAQAKWEDADTKEPVPPPADLIQKTTP